jgi:hypothetical protein
MKAKRRIAVAITLTGICLGLSGCATDGYVGVSTYPSYRPYYSYYGYTGVPYYGYGGIYTRNIVIRGQRHRGGYGRHHFSRDRGRDGGRHFSRSGGFHRSPGIRSGWRGRHRSR